MPRRKSARHPPKADLETRRIRWIEETAPPGPGAGFTVGIGDDAAVWTPSRGRAAVLTVDAQVEGTHFLRSWLTLREIGRRAASASLSDLAAMAARPACVLVSLVLEKGTPERDFRALFGGIREAAAAHGARIAGGNLSAGRLAIHITAIGEADPGQVLLRSGAAPGEEIWVTGTPGLARLGLLALRRGSGSRGGRRSAGAAGTPVEAAIRAFRRPEARVREALEIARSWRPSAMIDLSDGLAVDLRRVLEASSGRARRTLGAEIDEAALLHLPGLLLAARSLGEAPAGAALRGGEDYEILFTAPPRGGATGKALAFQRKLGLPLTRVGRTIDGPGLWLRKQDGSLRPVTQRGWSHWGR
jgi:thiamine-monophosphate kinase